MQDNLSEVKGGKSMKRFSRKIISTVLTLSMVCTFMISNAFAVEPTFMDGDFNIAGEGDVSLIEDEDGSELWLRYVQVTDTNKLAEYRSIATNIVVPNPSSSATLAIIQDELNMGLDGLLSQDVPYTDTESISDGSIIVGTPTSSLIINDLNWGDTLSSLGDEGYVIKSATIDGNNITVIASNGEFGALYGAFAFLRLIQTQKSLTDLDIAEKPAINIRQLDHWETERNYAGGNFIDWNSLPGTLLPRYTVFARACASVGINAFVFNNVNTSPNYLSANYIAKEKALADLFRPYGIKVYLSTPFNSPRSIATPTYSGVPSSPRLSTADPLDPDVIKWWSDMADAIYSQIPDFGGFLIKAGSEGQSGPGDYGRSHAEGANCLARALAPHGGIALWRSFVYDSDVDPDRLVRAYKEFKPLDGQFDSNVFVQTKNGPLDFQPREPFHPLFGQMPNTHQTIELQITQEYTGQGKMLCYLAPMWEEVLKSDTYANGPGSYVGNVIDGTLHGQDLTCIAGVSNIGSATNIVGQHFGGANLYAFGRFAWDWTLDSESIADDWIRMYWSNDQSVVSTIKAMMMGSREALVNYQESLGLLHQQSQTSQGDHYTPGPHESGNPAEWYGSYYNRADANGVGYDRSSAGSNLVGQYHPEVGTVFDNIDTCPESLLSTFYHVPWLHTMNSGRSFWDELCRNYQIGVHYVTNMRAQWDSVQSYIDSARFNVVQKQLVTHEADAGVWRDTCINYFKGVNGLPVPEDPLQLSDLQVNGVTISGFTPDQYNYTVSNYLSDELPQVSAVTDNSNVTVIVTQAEDIPGQAIVKVYAEEPFAFGPKSILDDYPNTILAVYTINFTDGTIIEPPVVAIEAEKAAENTEEAYVYGTINDHTWSLVDGQSTKAMVFGPDNGYAMSATDAASLANGSRLGYKINFPAAGTYHLWILAKAPDWNGDSIHVGLDNEYKFTVNGIASVSGNQWRWVSLSGDSGTDILGAATLDISPGIHELNLWGREDGLAIDRIYLTTSTETTDPVWPVLVTGVTLDKSTLNLDAGSTETLTATIAPENAANKNVIWSSSNPDVAKVDSTGKVTAVGEGTAEITVTTIDGGKTATCEVTVKFSYFKEKNGVVALEAEKAAENTVAAYVYGTINNHTWSLVDGDSTEAMLFGPDTGFNITATDAASLAANSRLGYKINFTTPGTYNVWVYAKAPNADGDSCHVGLDNQYKFSTHYAGINNTNVWAWNNIGSISNITAGIHELNIWAREDGFAIDRIYLTTSTDTTDPVWPSDDVAVTGVTLDKDTLNLVKGSSGILTATVTPEDATNKTVTFVSDNEAVAAVSGAIYDDATGTTSVIVDAIAEGTATITAITADGDKTAACIVTVYNNDGDKDGYIVTTAFNLSKLQPNKILTAKVTAKNSDSDITKALVIVALYDGDKMVNISYISKEIPIGASEDLTAGFKLPSTITSNHKVSVYVWDGNTIDSSNGTPLSKVTELLP